MKVKKRNIIIFLTPSIILFSLVFLIPLIIVFSSSFSNWKSGVTLDFVGLHNYIKGFSDSKLTKALCNTLVWVLLQSVVHVTFGTIIAFVLSRKFKSWKVFRTIIMIPNVISMAALAVIFLNIFSASQKGLINSIISFVIRSPFQWNWFFSTNTAFLTVTLTWLLFPGLITILVLTGISNVPIDIISSARIDGASNWQINIKIILPMIRNLLGTCVIIAATSMLREFTLIFLTTNGGPGNATINLPLYLYKTSLIDNNFGYANMMGVILIILGITIVAIINRIFRLNESD
ncbi:MAG: sugar ABC transporter permease [Spirochaetaceae bacterium]|nr:sugar ABC transporter permease [Spirochaetaceae bacterium]